MTSPITTEEAVLWGQEGRCTDPGMGSGQLLGPEDPAAGTTLVCSGAAGKKRKRRRKRHKAEPRKDEQTTAVAAGGEGEPCELSSDEEKAHSQWLVWVQDWVYVHGRKPLLSLRFISSGRLQRLRLTITGTSGSIPPSRPWNGTATPSLMETGLHAPCRVHVPDSWG